MERDKKLNPQGKNHVTRQTISILLNSYGLKDSTDVVKTISEEAMENRFSFALKWNDIQLNWERIVFSDESDLFTDKQGKLHYRCYEGERVDLDVGPTYRWDPWKVKVWGAISSTKVDTIVRYPGNMNGDMYTNILKENLLNDFPL